jgi:hypothetical protein
VAGTARSKFQKCLAAKRVSRTAPETAVTATILTRLCAAIESVEDTGASVWFALAFLRFDFCDARIAFPRLRVRLLGSLTLTLSLSSVCPRSVSHHDTGIEPGSLSGLVNQS